MSLAIVTSVFMPKDVLFDVRRQKLSLLRLHVLMSVSNLPKTGREKVLMIDQFMYGKVLERVNALGWQLDETEMNDLVDKETRIYHETMQREFRESLTEFLFDKYGTGIVQ